MRVDTSRKLGAALRGRRQELGLSQGEVAEQAGVSRKWLSEFESGKSRADLSLVLQSLAAVGLHLDVSSDASERAHTDEVPTVDLDGLLSDINDTGA